MIRPFFHRRNCSIRHCEPTGSANARPMTGSAKQSILRINTQSWIASSQALIAMTGLRRGQLLRRKAAVEGLALGRHLLEPFWGREARAVFCLQLVAQRDEILGPHEVDKIGRAHV